MAKDTISGVMVQLMKEIGRIIRLMDLEYIIGVMEEDMKENG